MLLYKLKLRAREGTTCRVVSTPTRPGELCESHVRVWPMYLLRINTPWHTVAAHPELYTLCAARPQWGLTPAANRLLPGSTHQHHAIHHPPSARQHAGTHHTDGHNRSQRANTRAPTHPPCHLPTHRAPGTLYHRLQNPQHKTTPPWPFPHLQQCGTQAPVQSCHALVRNDAVQGGADARVVGALRLCGQPGAHQVKGVRLQQQQRSSSRGKHTRVRVTLKFTPGASVAATRELDSGHTRASHIHTQHPAPLSRAAPCPLCSLCQ